MITAKIVETLKPIMTGRKFFRANSIAETPANPATATRDDHAMSVPPPDHTDPIWPIAANVEGSIPTAGAKAPDKEPVNGSPENPEPSKPAIIPITNKPNEVRMPLDGIKCCTDITKSKRMAGALSPSPKERILLRNLRFLGRRILRSE